MAITNLNLNVRANTARAMRDFKRFSDTLDNKFLVSGLKLDVIRSSLSQINREFQRSIGEQGLASASSLRAAQNQAALLTQTFKGFASESALAINREIGTALNSLAVRAGGTMKDVQKTISAASFVSIKMPQGEREQLLKDMMSLQRDMRRAGVTENFGGIAQQFLSGRVQAMDLIGSEDAGAAFIGAEILKRSGGRAQINDSRQRSQILAEVVSDPAIIAQFKEMARRTMGYRLVLEDLNTRLFNPEMGLFGSLRKVLGADGRYTTMFDQVEKLANTVFGPEGPFATFFKRIRDVFNIQDPMQPLIGLVQFTTKISEDINTFLQGDTFGGILRAFKKLFDSVSNFVQGPIVAKAIEDIKGGFRRLSQYLESEKFAELSESIKNTVGRAFNFLRTILKTFGNFTGEIATGSFEPSEIKESIKKIGESVRSFIKGIGKSVRDYDLESSKEAKFFVEIAGTLFTELGKTTITLIRELFSSLIDKIPELSSMVLPILKDGINTLMTEVFGQFSNTAKLLMATMPGPIGAIARSSVLTDLTGTQGGLGALAATAPFLLRGGGGLPGMGARALVGTGGGATAFRALGASLAGLDPTASLALAFAPQLLGNIPRSLVQQNQSRRNFLGSGPVGFLSRIGGRSITSATQFSSNLLSRGAATLSGYLGAVGPLIQSGGNLVQTGSSVVQQRLASYAGFLRGQRSQFMAGFKPTFPNVAIGAGTTRAYGLGQFVRNLPTNFSNLPSNTLALAQRLYGRGITAARGGIGAAGNVISRGLTTTSGLFVPIAQNANRFALSQISRAGNMYNNLYTGVRGTSTQFMAGFRPPFPGVAVGGATTKAYSAGQFLRNAPENIINLAGRIPSVIRGLGANISSAAKTSLANIVSSSKNLFSGVISLGSNLLNSSKAALGAIVNSIKNIVAGILSLGSSIFNNSKIALANMATATKTIVTSILTMGQNVIATSLTFIGKIAKATVNIVTSLVSMGTSALNAGMASANQIRMSSRALGLAALSGGVLFAGGQAIGSKVGGDKGELIGDVTGILGSIMTTAATGAMVGGPKGALIGGIIGGITAAIAQLTTKNIDINPPENNFSGKDFYGPAMALEARMSGRKPMVVNDGEFVIPSGSGMSTLSNLVGQNLQATGVLRQNQSREVAINVQLVVNNSAFVSNADELADRLRAPVHQIINEAWTKATQTVPYRPA